MARRPWFIAALVALLGLSIGGVLFAQMESGDRGILPLDSSTTIEVDGIHVDVGAKDGQTARLEGWRIAQREGFRKLWAQAHGVPIAQAPTISDSTLDQIVSSIAVEHEQIGPQRYIADLGVLFDRGRASQLLGIGGITQRSQPMLLIPLTVTAGTETTVELRNAWQRAWAEFRTSQSPIDYVRISGLGADPLLLNAAQTERPGRGWWRNLLDLYGADDILVAEVTVHRLYPGGPATAHFIGRHGPDGDVIGAFDMSGNDLQGLMNAGAQRMDQLFAGAFQAGDLRRDSTLNEPPPPPPPPPPAPTTLPAVTMTVQVLSLTPLTYNYALAHLRTVPGVDSVRQVNIAIGSVSNFIISYHGTVGSLRAILAARGWGVDVVDGNLRMFVKPLQPQPNQPKPNQPAPAAAAAAPGPATVPKGPQG